MPKKRAESLRLRLQEYSDIRVQKERKVSSEIVSPVYNCAQLIKSNAKYLKMLF